MNKNAKYIIENLKQIIEIGSNNEIKTTNTSIEFIIYEETYNFNISGIIDFNTNIYKYKLNLTFEQYKKIFAKSHFTYLHMNDMDNKFDESNIDINDYNDFIKDRSAESIDNINKYILYLGYDIDSLANSWTRLKLSDSFMTIARKLISFEDELDNHIRSENYNEFISILEKYKIGFGCDLYSKCDENDVEMYTEFSGKKSLLFFPDSINHGYGLTDATALVIYPEDNIEILNQVYNEVESLSTNITQKQLLLWSIDKIMNK